jgi:DNA-binding NarL/FixJ family response regulator
MTAEQFFRVWLVSHGNLTAKERDVAKLLMRGYSLRDVGRKMDIADTTAGVHACRIYAKVDVHSAGELAASLWLTFAADYASFLARESKRPWLETADKLLRRESGKL